MCVCAAELWLAEAQRSGVLPTLETSFYIIVSTFNYYLLVLSFIETFLSSNSCGAFHIYQSYLIPGFRMANHWYAFDPAKSLHFCMFTVRSDCVDILTHCGDFSRFPEGHSPERICDLLSPTDDAKRCIPLQRYLSESSILQPQLYFFCLQP